MEEGLGSGGWLLFLCPSRRYTAKHKMMSNFFKHDIKHTNSILTANGSPITLAAGRLFPLRRPRATRSQKRSTKD